MTHARSFCSFVSMWMSLVASEMATASTPQSMRGLDVGDVRAVPAEHRRLQAQVRDLLDDLALVAAHDRDAGLDLVDADPVEHLGDRDLLGVREHDAGGLLAVTQRRVVELYRRCAEVALDRQLHICVVSTRANLLVSPGFTGRARRPGEDAFGAPSPRGPLESGRHL